MTVNMTHQSTLIVKSNHFAVKDKLKSQGANEVIEFS
jgi:hypothetical protein